jgi:AcrR family transcriptional regulator
MTTEAPPAPGLREAKRARNEDAIERAALALFRAHGFEATTIDQIAAAAGVSRRTVFRYFPTKDALVFPRARERVARFRGLLEPRDGEAPFETVRRAVLALGRELQADREAQLLQQRLIAASPALAASERDLDLKWEAALADALGAGRTGQAGRKARLAAGAVVGALRAALRGWFEADGRGDLVKLGEEALAVVAPALESLKSKGGTS